MHDSHTSGIYAYAVPHKGIDHSLVKKIAEDLDNLGYKKVLYRSDQEPSVTALLQAVKAHWSGEMVPEESPVGEKQSNGHAERTCRTIEGLMRTLKFALESKVNQQIPPEAAILAWIAEHAGTLYRRHNVGADGKTPYERRKGKMSHRVLAEIGELVWYMPLESTKKAKLDPRYEKGVFLGIVDRSDEAILGVEGGIVRARTIRRLEDSERWDPKAVLAVTGIPINPNQGSDDMRIRIRIGQQHSIQPDLPPEPKIQRVTLRPHDFRTHGYTENCKGCNAILYKKTPQGHSERCRQRMETILADSEAGRARLAIAQQRKAQHEEIVQEKESKRQRVSTPDTQHASSVGGGY